jgi:hypothetical protein
VKCHRFYYSGIHEELKMKMQQKIQKWTLCKNTSSYTTFFTTISSLIAVVTLLTITSCATPPPPPTQALQAAESAIENADQERVSDYDLPELSLARNKLTAARAAVSEKNMVLAKSLADESRVSAELASAKAAKIKAGKVNEDMHKSIETLKQEMQRHNGDMQ